MHTFDISVDLDRIYSKQLDLDPVLRLKLLIFRQTWIQGSYGAEKKIGQEIPFRTAAAEKTRQQESRKD